MEVDSDGNLRHLVICGQSGPEAVAGKVFIDCTGEAQVAYAAGCATMKGREADGKTLAMSLMAFVRHVFPGELNDVAKRRCWEEMDYMIAYAACQIPEGRFGPIGSKDDLPMVSIWPAGPGCNALKIKVAGYDSTDTESMTAAEIEGRRSFARVLDYYQRIAKEPWIMDHASPIIGLREGRRVVGDYVLTLDDVKGGREFADGVARGTWYLDAHSPDNNKRTFDAEQERVHPEVPPYQIPLRCLVARDSQNLLMAGRCLSADRLAQSTARVSPTGGMMGQATGILAALAVEQGRGVRDVEPQEVRQTVLDRNANLDV